MRTHRLYTSFAQHPESEIQLDKDRSHYLKNVLRAKKGQQVRIFNNELEYLTEISLIERHHITLKVIEAVNSTAPSKLQITLLQSISKGDRMDYSVQKATELGVTAIQPLFSEFCDVKIDDKRLSKKMNHWRNIAISASEQSYRADVPEILSPMNLTEYCKQSHQGFYLEPEASDNLADAAKNPLKEFKVAIGPEGGWSENDIRLLRASGLQGIHFGQRILRTETMAPAILAAIHVLWGDFC